MRTAALLLALALVGCAGKPAPHPPQADIQALTESKPKPPVAILTDPAASDRYNSAIEAWGDRLSSAGKRLCAFYARTGMDIDCATDTRLDRLGPRVQ